MPTSTEHDEKIVRNTDVTQLLNQHQQRYNEWIAVTAFYSVIHIIERYFSNHPHLYPHERHSEDHRDRRDKLFSFIDRGIIVNQSLKRKYNLISNAAHISRYNSMNAFSRQYDHRIPELLNIVREFDTHLI